MPDSAPGRLLSRQNPNRPPLGGNFDRVLPKDAGGQYWFLLPRLHLQLVQINFVALHNKAQAL
jgi:hypothetical protein